MELLQHLRVKQALRRLTEPCTKALSSNPLIAGFLIACGIKAIAGSKASSRHGSLFLFCINSLREIPVYSLVAVLGHLQGSLCVY